MEQLPVGLSLVLKVAAILLGLCTLAVIVTQSVWLAAERNRGMRQFCIDHGFESLGRDNRVLSVLAPFVLGHRLPINNAIRSMSGTHKGVHVIILDLCETRSIGRISVSQTQTAVCVSSPSLDLPRFMIVPHRVSGKRSRSIWSRTRIRDNLQKLKCARSCMDIDISDCPALAVEYTVRGTDKGAVRRLLTRRAIQHLSHIKSLCVEGYENRLVVWREGHVVPVDKLAEVLAEAMSICETFAT